ncbi:MAG: hypothetical protein CMN04_05650 [Roseibacillus sp.]|nr:hypothetical protein [Roseibacillus sp.]
MLLDRSFLLIYPNELSLAARFLPVPDCISGRSGSDAPILQHQLARTLPKDSGNSQRDEYF